MKIKVEEEYFSPGNRHVQIQVTTNGKWYDFGPMNMIERKELANQLRQMATELVKSPEGP